MIHLADGDVIKIVVVPVRLNSVFHAFLGEIAGVEIFTQIGACGLSAALMEVIHRSSIAGNADGWWISDADHGKAVELPSVAVIKSAEITIGRCLRRIDAKEGMKYRVESYGNDNNLYHVTVSQVNQTSLGNARYFPFTQLTFDCDYAGGITSSNRVTATQFFYDPSNGNLTNKIEYGEVSGFNPTNTGGFAFTDVNTADTRSYNTHYTAIGTYIVDHPDKTTLTDSGNNVIQETDFSYNSPSGTLATKLTRIASSYLATNSYGYNSYNLVSSKTDPVGVQTTIIFLRFGLQHLSGEHHGWRQPSPPRPVTTHGQDWKRASPIR